MVWVWKIDMTMMDRNRHQNHYGVHYVSQNGKQQKLIVYMANLTRRNKQPLRSLLYIQS
uniref:Uncharacterized protein n=1 Tax=Musa acuminata subsp. malaccensis TaxID=214687 RepID=A0A804JMN6_MUSAM